MFQDTGIRDELGTSEMSQSTDGLYIIGPSWWDGTQCFQMDKLLFFGWRGSKSIVSKNSTCFNSNH